MIPPGHIILVISRGDKIIYEKEGIEEKVIFEDLPCAAVNVDDPYVQILAEED